ncbi:GNAT family N-acetyltransferase [Butyrivibrio fibrisolvens]|jgi:ribosomal protein S18 acetylase RimI-like enzyme|uniref:GNAT family N-acetyltransferase n=1 Tax=Butyrivibrio fibrisolvens TaxID=831 RepID=UPI0003B4C619|nr:GNAT family N-acetyltransferase [Butyrivibrio fibrisolvens]
MIELVDNILTPEDFVRLRTATGFADIPLEHARKALQNGLINVSAIKDGELIGMGRLVGDGAMYWYLQEIVVLPKYQRQGIGTQLLEFAKEKYDCRFLWTLEKNKEAIHFYETHGFNLNGKRQLEEGTPEYIVMLERD